MVPQNGELCRREGEAAQWLGRMGSIEEAGNLCLYIAAEATFSTGVSTSSPEVRNLDTAAKLYSQAVLD